MNQSSNVNQFKRTITFFLIGMLTVFISCGEDEEEVTEILVSHISIKGDFILDGGSSQLTAIVSPENATNTEVNWEVSNTDIATISSSGLLTAIDDGIVTVKATATDGSGVFGSKSFDISGVHVVEPTILVEEIIITGSNVTEGEKQQLQVEVLPSNALNKAVKWSVSDENIAEVSNQGMLTPLSDGELIVIAEATDGSGVRGELTLIVRMKIEKVEGTIVDSSSDIISALSSAKAGDKIYIRGGNYTFNSTVRFGNDGTSDNMISLQAYPGERPVFDFSSMSENSSNRGIMLSGDFWHVKGIDVYNAGDNGMFISGNNNLVEFCNFYENSDSGLQIGNGASNNTVLNCDSYYNADSSIENADGFACKLDAGDGNKFIGCRAWQNLDDGWDGYMRGNDNITTTYENCWAFLNGVLKNGNVGGGDGNGFKTGGSDNKELKHNGIYTNCIAAGNVVDGFDHNSNRGDIVMYNCAAHDNGRNINFGSGNIANTLIIKNTISIGGSGDSYLATTTDLTNNSWQDGLSVTSADFESLNYELLKSERKADGSLPDIDYLKLVSGSDLINAGVDVGLPFNGTSPDIGPFEY